MGNQREITSNDIDTAVELLSERIDVVASTTASTNRTISAIERHVKSISGAVHVIMWVVIVMLVIQIFGIVYSVLSAIRFQNELDRIAVEVKHNLQEL